jgi:hypothetical protein
MTEKKLQIEVEEGYFRTSVTGEKVNAFPRPGHVKSCRNIKGRL